MRRAHSSEYDEGCGQRKQTDQNGENCSSEAWQNECGDQFHGSLGGRITPDIISSTELVVAEEFGRFTNEFLHGQYAVEENAEAFDRIREWDSDIIKIKG